jgi:hypothetical protein
VSTLPGRRFAPPPVPIQHERFRHAGLGSDTNETVPAGQAESIRHLQETLPEGGFTGIRSRSRFFKLLTPRPVGHGSAQASGPNPGQGPDPAAGETQFDEDGHGSTLGGFGPPLPERIAGRAGARPTPALDGYSEAMVDSGQMIYVRRNTPTSTAALIPIGPPRWSDAGPPPQTYRRTRYTLRREFEQGAQTFAGIRFTLRRGAHVSTSPVRMLPPRTNRLTDRVLPRSVGSTTDVLTDTGDGS